MHEFTVAEALLTRLEELEASEDGSLPAGGWHVTVRVPVSACLSPAALHGACEVLRELGDGPQRSIDLVFEEVPGEAACRTCPDVRGQPLRFPFASGGPSLCPSCGRAGRRVQKSAWIDAIDPLESALTARS